MYYTVSALPTPDELLIKTGYYKAVESTARFQVLIPTSDFPSLTLTCNG